MESSPISTAASRLFFAGTSLFLAASLLCGFAWGMESLIFFRALQGVGAGAIQPIATTIVGGARAIGGLSLVADSMLLSRSNLDAGSSGIRCPSHRRSSSTLTRY